MDLLLLPPWRRLAQRRTIHGTLPTTRKSCTKVHCCPQKNWVESTAQGNETKAGEKVLLQASGRLVELGRPGEARRYYRIALGGVSAAAGRDCA